MKDVLSKMRGLGILAIAVILLLMSFDSGFCVEAKVIDQVSAVEESGAIIIRVDGNDLTYTSVKQPVPLSVILYFPETRLAQPDVDIMENDVIDSIQAKTIREKGLTSRIDIRLKQDAPYEVAKVDNGLKIVFPKADAQMPERGIEEIESGERADGSTGLGQASDADMSSSSGGQKSTTAKNDGTNWVNRIDFASEEAGRSTIIIGTSQDAQYEITKASEKRLDLRLSNTRIPDYRKRPLITTRFPSAVDRVLPVQAKGDENTALFVIDLREAVPYYVEQSDNLLMVHFEASTVPPRTIADADLPDWQRALVQGQATVDTSDASMGTNEVQMQDETAPEENVDINDRFRLYRKEARQYKGEKIALDFYETDIKNVFRILKEVSGKNFAIDKDVTGKVTLTFDKPVPWDQILDLVLDMNQLGRIEQGGVIRIATQATISKEETARANAYAAARKAKEEQEKLEPLITAFIPVNYADADTIYSHLEDFIDTTQSNSVVTVDKRTNTIIVTETAGNVAKIKDLVRNLDKVTPQVIIEARVVEATTTFTKGLGTEWGSGWGVQSSELLSVPGLTSTVTNDLNQMVGYGPERGYDTLGGSYGMNMALNTPLPADDTASIGFNFIRIAGTPLLLNAKLMAQESQGKVKILSAPKILTLDNKTAKISQGISYPYYKLDDDGNSTTAFMDIDLSLEVTPHVTSDNRVSMVVKVEKFDLGQVINGRQSFTTKAANTELLLDDGETVVIGGIIKSSETVSDSSVPGLSKIPALGWLFKSNYNEDTKDELLIFITPRIVKYDQKDFAS